MPQWASTPTRPTSAAQRGGVWSVPRMRQVLAVTSTVKPSGMAPPNDNNSARAKSTRKLAQQAPHSVQGLAGWAMAGIVRGR